MLIMFCKVIQARVTEVKSVVQFMRQTSVKDKIKIDEL